MTKSTQDNARRDKDYPKKRKPRQRVGVVVVMSYEAGLLFTNFTCVRLVGSNQFSFGGANGLGVYSSSPGSSPWLRERDLQSQRDLEVKASVIER